MTDSVTINGKFTITNNHTGAVRTVQNIVTDGGLANISALLAGSGGGVYAWVALGSSTTAVSASDTSLGTETFRTAVTEITAAAGVCTAVFDLLLTEAVGDFEEIGVFVGGTSAADSGTLVSHALLDFSKTADEELFITYDFTIARAI